MNKLVILITRRISHLWVGARLDVCLSLAAVFVCNAVWADEGWTTVQHLQQARISHTQTLLDNGLILIAGGDISSTSYVATAACELFDPVNLTVTPAAPMRTPRMFHDAVKLGDGRVLVVGGQAMGESNLVSTASCEIYDPAADRWEPVADMGVATANCALALLDDGTVLRAGGASPKGYGIYECEIYNPEFDYWFETGRMHHPRQTLDAWTKLADGRILVAGGYADLAPDDASSDPFIETVEVYDATMFTWSLVGTLGRKVSGATVEQLDDGRTFMMGGLFYDKKENRPIRFADVTVYDPATETLSVGPAMPVERNDFASVKTARGNILVVGGTVGDEAMATACHLFLPKLNAWVNAPSLPRPQRRVQAILAAGKVFLIGGLTPRTGEPGYRLVDEIQAMDVDALTVPVQKPLAYHGASGLMINGPLGATYRIDLTDDLSRADGWQTLTSVTVTQLPMVVPDTQPAAESPRKFYRATRID